MSTTETAGAETMPLTEAELRDLFRAKRLLENPGFAARAANALGAPLERGFARLPKRWSNLLHVASRRALSRATDVALLSLGSRGRGRSADFQHKLLVGATGCLGGAFGLAALAIELPISTTLILRSIADIARHEGHDLRSAEVRLSCLEVFALGGRTKSDDAAESAYWLVRAATSQLVAEAAAYFAQRGGAGSVAPSLVRLTAAIAARFGVVISEQAAAKAIPILGAASGSLINVLFMDHFQRMARGHFIVRRLEGKYGLEVVRDVYHSLAIPV